MDQRGEPVNSGNDAATVYVNGSVYSPVDPFATAVLVVGSTVAWLGSDAAAQAAPPR